MQENNKQMENLIKECIEKIYHANSHEELKTFFKEKNLNVTDDQIKNIVKGFAYIYKNPKELAKVKDLTDDDLENIAGGSNSYEYTQVGGGLGALLGGVIGLMLGIFDMCNKENELLKKREKDGTTKLTPTWKKIFKLLGDTVLGATAFGVPGGLIGYAYDKFPSATQSNATS